jgi:hypothetical protein
MEDVKSGHDSRHQDWPSAAGIDYNCNRYSERRSSALICSDLLCSALLSQGTYAQKPNHPALEEEITDTVGI